MTMIKSLLLILFSADTYVYFGWAVLIILSLLLWWSFRRRRKGRNWIRWTLAVLLCSAWVAFLYGAYFGFAKLEVRRVELAFADLPPAFDGYRIVLWSDAHVGSYTGAREGILRRAVDSIKAQQADMVIFAGDLQNKVPEEIEPWRDLLSSITAKDGVYSVLGNHDYPYYVDKPDYEKYEQLGKTVGLEREMGWTLLPNAHRMVYRGGDSIVVAGMENDSRKRFGQKGDIGRTLWGVIRDCFVVMIEHDPSTWRRKILPRSHSQLTLSGHTHGGQFRLFGWTPASWMCSENDGLYEYDGRKLFVTHGLGGVIPMRWGVPGEIVVITLSQKPS